jgi:hypothetical protein
MTRPWLLMLAGWPALALADAPPAAPVDSYRFLHVTIDTPWHIFLFLLVGVFAPFILMVVLVWRNYWRRWTQAQVTPALTPGPSPAQRERGDVSPALTPGLSSAGVGEGSQEPPLSRSAGEGPGVRAPGKTPT